MNLLPAKPPGTDFRLFSDDFKCVKVCISLIILVLLGVYYRHNINDVVLSREHTRNLFKKGANFQLCRYGVKIRQTDGIFYFAHHVDGIYTIIELENIPDFVKQNLKDIYAIKGKIVYGTLIDVKEVRTESNYFIRGTSQNGDVMEDATIRTKYPRIYQLASLEFLKSKRKGKILRYGTIMEVEDIRAKYPRIYKIALSGLTALIICSLFFTFHRFTRKGFVCKDLC